MGSLNVFQQATVGAAGTAQVELGPVPPFKTWRVARLAVLMSGSALQPEARVYRNAVDDSAFVDGTYSGANDSADYPTPITLGQGEKLIVRWTGASPAAIATARIDGELG